MHAPSPFKKQGVESKNHLPPPPCLLSLSYISLAPGVTCGSPGLHSSVTLRGSESLQLGEGQGLPYSGLLLRSLPLPGWRREGRRTEGSVEVKAENKTRPGDQGSQVSTEACLLACCAPWGCATGREAGSCQKARALPVQTGPWMGCEARILQPACWSKVLSGPLECLPHA
jgi:hypothetical protein